MIFGTSALGSSSSNSSSNVVVASEFVYGFLCCADGEKDPRILLVIFSLWPLILQQYRQPSDSINSSSGSGHYLDRFLEEIFEVISCYFPITFTSKANDPDRITKEDLQEQLLNCLKCPALAPQTVPFLLEKIWASVTATKKDALASLLECCKNYIDNKNASLIQPHIQDIWKTLWNQVCSLASSGSLGGRCRI